MLRRLLEDLRSAGQWRTLLAQLDPWPADVTLDEVERAASQLPDELRGASSEAWRAARAGEPPAWWPLVRHVSLSDDDDPDDPDVMAALARVTSLKLTRKADAWLMDGLARLPQLTQLTMISVFGWQTCEQLPDMPALVELQATGAPDLNDLAGLERQPSLRVLKLTDSRSVDFDTLPALPQLHTLAADRTPLADLAPLAELTGLEVLSVPDCPIADVAPLAACTQLRFLDLSRLPALTSIAPLAALGRLERLWLDGRVDLAPLAGLPLRELIVRGGRADTAAIGQLAALDQLHLADLAAIDLRGLAGSALTQLFVLRCAHVEGLAALPALELLVLEELPELRDLAGIAQLPALRRLHISKCAALTDISALAAARNLEQLVLRSCPAVADASVIATLPALTQIDLDGTPMHGLAGYAPRGA